MTREEMLRKCAEQRAKAEAKANEYNDALISKASAIDLNQKAEILAEIIKEYDRMSRTVTFEDCRLSEDPMKAAVLKLTYPTLKTVFKATSGDPKELKMCSVIEAEKAIPLDKLHAYCDGIGADKKWIYYAQQLNLLITAKTAKELNNNVDLKAINDSYAMDKIARELDMGKTPTSNTQLLKQLNIVIAAMLGSDFKGTSHDVAFLVNAWSKKGKKALSIVAARHTTMYNLMLEICHAIMTEKVYELEIKEVSRG